MYKIFSYLVVSLLLVGCAAEKTPQIKEQTKPLQILKKDEVKKFLSEIGLITKPISKFVISSMG